MKLPSDNSITLPALNQSTLVADATDPPVPFALADLLRYLPEWARAGDAQVRDAMALAYAEMARLAWAQFSRRLNSQRTARHAAGPWLSEHGAELHIQRAPGESEPAYRERLLAGLDRITPAAIIAAVDGLAIPEIAPLRPFYQEPANDGFFLGYTDGSGDQIGDWSCFWQDLTQIYLGWDTVAPDPWIVRGIYYEAAPSNGIFGAFFRVILPVDTDPDADGVFLTAAFDEFTFFTSALDEFNFYQRPVDPLTGRIISAVESRRLAGVRWELVIDPLLSSAV